MSAADVAEQDSSGGVVGGGGPTDEGHRLIENTARAADILSLFLDVQRPDLGVTDIANKLGLSKAVVHRLLTTMVVKQLIQVDDGRRYRLGPLVLSLGMAFLSHLDIRAAALPVLRELSERTNETATLSLRYGWQRTYVEQVTPDREVKMEVAIGRQFPLNAGSTSKAFLAGMRPDQVDRYFAEQALEALTDRTITDEATLRQEISRARSRGYSVSYGERQPGAGSVAAAVFDHNGNVAAVISVCGPIERFRDGVDFAARLLVAATADLSRRLGYRPKAA